MIPTICTSAAKAVSDSYLTCAPLTGCFRTLSKHVDKVKSSPLCTFVQNRSCVFATSCLENGVGEGEGRTLPQMRNKAGNSS